MGINRLKQLRERIKSFDENLYGHVKEIIVENEVYILNMNTQQQLYNKGINTLGIDIFSYAPYADSTIRMKKRTGRPHDRVTLYQTGNYHENFIIEAREDEFEIIPPEYPTKYWVGRYGKASFGLTNDHISKLKKEIVLPELLKKLKQTIYGN